LIIKKNIGDVVENLVGKTLDNYTILGQIGSDEIGVVFKAPDIQLD
jgi:hypothetical protein